MRHTDLDGLPMSLGQVRPLCDALLNASDDIVLMEAVPQRIGCMLGWIQYTAHIAQYLDGSHILKPSCSPQDARMDHAHPPITPIPNMQTQGALEAASGLT